MTATYLYRFMTQPLSFIREFRTLTPAKFGFICVLLSAVANFSVYSSNPLSMIASIGVSVMGTYGFLVVHCVLIDFFAQLLGGKAQSLKLVHWFAVCLLPLSLNATFFLISAYTPQVLSWVGHLGFFATFVFSCVLQIGVVKSGYQFSKLRAVFLYIVPFVGLIGFIFVMLLLLGYSLI